MITFSSTRSRTPTFNSLVLRRNMEILQVDDHRTDCKDSSKVMGSALDGLRRTVAYSMSFSDASLDH